MKRISVSTKLVPPPPGCATASKQNKSIQKIHCGLQTFDLRSFRLKLLFGVTLRHFSMWYHVDSHQRFGGTCFLHNTEALLPSVSCDRYCYRSQHALLFRNTMRNTYKGNTKNRVVFLDYRTSFRVYKLLKSKLSSFYNVTVY